MKLRNWLVLAVSTALFGGSRTSRAADAGSQDLAAQQVVHLLEYVGSDYGGAVKEGQVVNETELTEQLEVIAEAERIAAKLVQPRAAAAPGQRPPREAVLEVRRLVESHRAEGEVSRAVKAVSAELVAEFALVQAPEAAPSHERGKLLFETHCAVCHGQDGRANTPRATQYTPRPANFHDPAVARALSPLRVFTTVRFGVPQDGDGPLRFPERRRSMGSRILCQRVRSRAPCREGRESPHKAHHPRRARVRERRRATRQSQARRHGR